MRIADLRADCKRQSPDEARVDTDPFRQFARWFDEAVEAQHRAAGERVPRPPHRGGCRVIPRMLG